MRSVPRPIPTALATRVDALGKTTSKMPKIVTATTQQNLQSREPLRAGVNRDEYERDDNERRQAKYVPSGWRAW